MLACLRTSAAIKGPRVETELGRGEPAAELRGGAGPRAEPVVAFRLVDVEPDEAEDIGSLADPLEQQPDVRDLARARVRGRLSDEEGLRGELPDRLQGGCEDMLENVRVGGS